MAKAKDASSITELHEKIEEEVARINFLIRMSKVSIHEVNALGSQPIHLFETSEERAIV